MQQTLTFLHGSTLIHAPNPPASANMSTTLDAVVKGTPSPTAPPPPPIEPLSISNLPRTNPQTLAPKHPVDPISALPSSPPQIYLNLLILESSLRSQHLSLVSRWRLNTFFILLLLLWNSTLVYLLFLHPREDGHGLGGSVYWVVETLEKVALMGGVVTGLLIWGTGQYERGIRWPRKWVGTTNRGLRGFNLRVVIIRRKWWRELLAQLAFLFPPDLFGETGHSDWHYVEHDTRLTHSRSNGDEESCSGLGGGGLIVIEEDLAPGGDYIKLLLLPKSFSPDFRQNWEEYRSEYWEKENARRAHLRRKIQQNRRARAKAEDGWRWWTGLWRVLQPPNLPSPQGGGGKQHHGTHRQGTLNADKSSRRLSLMRSDSTHSRQSSRSSTPYLEVDGTSEKPLSDRSRRPSGAGGTGNTRRKKSGGGGGSARNSVIAPLSRADSEEAVSLRGSRPSTPGGFEYGNGNNMNPDSFGGRVVGAI